MVKIEKRYFILKPENFTHSPDSEYPSYEYFGCESATNTKVNICEEMVPVINAAKADKLVVLELVTDETAEDNTVQLLAPDYDKDAWWWHNDDVIETDKDGNPLEAK